MLWGYNTNGFAHHPLEEALRILARLGYQSIALTLDYYALSPYDPATPRQAVLVRDLLDQLGLRVVIETGSRFLLDPMRKHQPTLVSERPEGRERRLAFLRTAIELAVILRADTVSFWSGAPDAPAPEEVLFDRLVAACSELASYAAARGVRLAFEPEPGMFIDTMARFAELHARVGHPAFGLTLDIGHLYCLGEEPVAPHVRRWKEWLWNVHLEDMRRGTHDHLMFGEGDIDFAEAIAALEEVGYEGGVHVELSRHSHDAVETARRSLQFLSSCKRGA
jgi:sugar phosphate isomerase/epimerase